MNKIKVALIEFDYHAEVLRNTLHILNQNAIEVVVYTSEKIWNDVNWKESPFFELHIWKKRVAFSEYLTAEIDSINKNDLVLFNTVASNYKAWAQANISAYKLLRIHNSNTYLNTNNFKFDFKLSLFHMWKDTSHIIRKSIGELDWYYRNQFMKKLDGYVFPNEFTKEYAIDNYGVSDSSSWSLPFGYIDKVRSTSEKTNSVKIGVIGKVDQRYRDYQCVIDSIKQIVPQLKSQNKKIELVLQNH